MLRSFERVLAKAQGMRRLGSAAIDLSYVAAGRFDAYWEENLKPWDVAAGSLILKEAGGKITDYTGRDNYIFGSELAATNGLLHKEMLRLVGIKK
jgi:myo-inositol-1(or 4)-monophosphatase